jgi:hypothetical protein
LGENISETRKEEKWGKKVDTRDERNQKIYLSVLQVRIPLLSEVD